MSNNVSSTSNATLYVIDSLEYSGYILAAITIIALSLFWYFLVLNRRSITIFNAARAEKLLVLLGTNTAAQYILNSLSYYQLNPTQYIIADFLYYIMAQSFNVVYIQLCWTRSKSIMKELYPAQFNYINLFVKYGFPVFLIFPVPVWTYWNWTVNVLNIDIPALDTSVISLSYMSSAIIGIADLFLMVTFTMFLRKTRIHASDTTDPKFIIIAFYSSFASVLMMISLIAGMTSIFITDNSVYYTFFFITQSVLLGFVWFSLIMMKVALVCYENLKRSSRNISQINSTRMTLFPFLGRQDNGTGAVNSAIPVK